MFPVPVGPTNAASQQFGAFRQQQEQRQFEEEHPDRVVHAERQREAALAHEEDIEDELDAVEAYENTLSRSGRQPEAYPNQMTASTFTSPEDERKQRSEPVVYQPAQNQQLQVQAQQQQQPVSADSGAAVAAAMAGPAAHHAANNGTTADQLPVAAATKERRPSVVGPRSADEVSALAAQGKLAKQGSQSNLHEDTLHLGQITDADIRNALDPVNQSFSVTDLMEWPEEKLMRLVDHVQPQHLPVLMNRRLQVHEKESAKNFSFHHLTYEKNGETVLNDVSGYMEAGMLVGLLGAPDSGITPLFNILTGRLKVGRNSRVTGDILYDGRKRTADFNRWVGYVVKEDPHLAHMTVFETLYFSARLRLPDMPPKIVRMRVAITLKLLGLSHVANSVVGDGSLRGISGGEKRRVSFGIEMVAGHACIIADLPTNGLDSASAYSLMRTMRFATKIGFSMMASVVQPSPQLLRLFHRVMVMSKGTVIYFGPVSQAEEFFKNAGFIRPAAKALPQFIEEVTLKPELFYKTKRYKELSNNEPMTNAQYQQAQNTMTPASAGRMAAEQKQMEQKQSDDMYASPQAQAAAGQAGQIEMQRPVDASSPGHMAIVVNDEGGNAVHKPGITHKQFDSQPPPHGLDEGASGGQPKWGNHVLPNNINRSRYDSFMLILNAYHGSEFYKEVMTVLDQQKQLQQQHKQEKHSINHGTANGKQPLPLNDPTHLHTANGPQGEQIASNERGWGPMGRWWYHYYNSSPWLQLWMNIHRQSVLTVRNTGLWRDTWLTSLVMGFFLGSLFYKVGYEYQDVRNRVGLFFFILSYLAFNAVMLVPVLAHQREVYYNQSAGGYYHGFTYYISHFLTQIPIVVVETFILLLPVWGLANLAGPTCGREFWYAYLVIGFNSLISRVWMILLASVSPNEVYADVLNTVTNIIFTKLCGYFIAASNIVNGWYWVYTISYFTYALRGLAKNDINEAILIPACKPPNADYCYDPRNCPYSPQEFATPQEPCDYNTGAGALYVIFGIDPSIGKWGDFVDLVWFLIAFNVGAMIASTYVNWSTADEPEHPDFGNAMDKKHREMHSDIMRSSKQKQPTSQSQLRREATQGQQQAQIEAPPATQYDTVVTADGTTMPNTSNTLVAAPVNNNRLATPNAAGNAAGNTAYPADGTTPGADADGEDEANIAANTMTYNHRVGTIDLDRHTSPLKTKKAYLEFEDLCYTVMVGKEGGGTEPRMLLNHCFGYAKPSMMTALMGASGAGKSTLLDVLAGKKTGGTITGSILVNGVAPDYAGSFSRVAGYVEQFDSSPYNPHSRRLRTTRSLFCSISNSPCRCLLAVWFCFAQS